MREAILSIIGYIKTMMIEVFDEGYVDVREAVAAAGL